MPALRANELFDMDPLETTFRNLIRPWRIDASERTPQIRVDVSEVDGSYSIKAEIPGVQKDDIDVRIDGNQVTISAELRHDHEEKSGRLLRSERQYGFSSRTISLSDVVDEGKADAKYLDGVLQLTLPKLSPVGHKRLTIN